MPWLLLLAIAGGFLIKYLVTNQAAKEVLRNSFQGLGGKIKEARADGGIKLREKFDEFIEIIRYHLGK